MLLFSRMRINQVSAGLAIATGLLAIPKESFAQGCEPIRFSSFSLGGQGESYQKAHQWRVTLGYRRLYTNQWYVGTTVRNDLAPGGISPIVSIHTVVGDVSYALTDRVTLHLSLPFSTGSGSRVYPPDSVSHKQSATGIGDVSLLGNVWVLDPPSHPEGNIAFGFGVKAPTGSNHVANQWYWPTGPVPFAADPSIEPGDGGWGIIVQTEAFRQLFRRAYAYLNGSYMFSPRARTDVVARMPNSGEVWSVPDIYSGRLGLAYSLLPGTGLSVSLGGRIDGLPVHDVFGGGDDAARRPGYVIYADPGIALTSGRDNFTLSVPLRLHANRQKSVLEQGGSKPAGGGFAKLLIFAGYSHRF